MNSTHTPGPWSLSASFDSVERRVQHGDNPPLVWGIASGINSAHPDYMPREEQIANARLIAAATELLEALEGITMRFDIILDLGKGDLLALSKARAAIAKATATQ